MPNPGFGIGQGLGPYKKEAVLSENVLTTSIAASLLMPVSWWETLLEPSRSKFSA